MTTVLDRGVVNVGALYTPDLLADNDNILPEFLLING
jgi:hypothetical protein